MFDLNHVVEQIHKEKNIEKDVLIEAIEAAMLSAARKKLGFYGDLEAQYNPDLGEVEVFQFKTVVEDVEDDQLEVDLAKAKAMDEDAVVRSWTGFASDELFVTFDKTSGTVVSKRLVPLEDAPPAN